MTPPGNGNKFWTIPNALSIARIFVSPILVVLLLSPDEKRSVIAAALFLAVCLTDWLDGYLARRMGIVTAFGKFLDPLADKLLIVTALIMLIPGDRIPAWMVAVIVARELAVTGLRALAVESGTVMAASPSGKIKTVLQICAVTPLLLHYEFFGLNFHSIGSIILWAALAATVWSGVEYFAGFFKGAFRTRS
ncbi:MAG TPA: CDP-diacylglycerol--glycerol-3-phosphate 3-phosphatidyltransferase [Thermodesulfobacteriota bacterium]|nr:CDP-diacylglycerol--glycerol-3-phosphate 3-phosphatidyltransferase [Thermodesulfobacteriota bacterium]